MRHRSSTTVYGQWIKLVKKTNPKTGRKHYSVIADVYEYTNKYSCGFEVQIDLRVSLHKHFDPAGNRGMRTGLSWKFGNKEQAEQLITLALLKWGERYVA